MATPETPITSKTPKTPERVFVCDGGPGEPGGPEYQERLAAALAAQLARQQADPGLPDRLLANARRFARALGAEVVDVTPMFGEMTSLYAGLENRKRLYFLRRAPATEACFARHAPLPIRHGQFTLAPALPVALLFHISATGDERFLTIPSEAAFTEDVFEGFYRE